MQADGYNSYIDACTNEIRSLTNLQDLIPTLAGLCCLLCLPNLRLKVEDILKNVFYLCTHEYYYPAEIIFAITDTQM